MSHTFGPRSRIDAHPLFDGDLHAVWFTDEARIVGTKEGLREAMRQVAEYVDGLPTAPSPKAQ